MSMLKGRRLAVVLIIVGVGLLAGGWRTHGFFSDLLLNIGTALLLLAPLLSLQRLLEARVTRVEKETSASVANLSSEVADVKREIAETTARLDQLGEATTNRLRKAQDQDARAFQQFEEAPSATVLFALLERAKNLRAIAWDGVRVQVPGTWNRLRFRSNSDDEHLAPHLSVQIEELDGRSLQEVLWEADQPADEFMLNVAEELQMLGEFRPDTFDATQIFANLLSTLRLAIECRTGVGPYSNIGDVIEIPNDQWIITTDGLYAPEASYFYPIGRVREPDASWHIKKKKWVDPDKFEEAWDIIEAMQRRQARPQLPS
jgi:hypothetical protein